MCHLSLTKEIKKKTAIKLKNINKDFAFVCENPFTYGSLQSEERWGRLAMSSFYVWVNQGADRLSKPRAHRQWLAILASATLWTLTLLYVCQKEVPQVVTVIEHTKSMIYTVTTEMSQGNTFNLPLIFSTCLQNVFLNSAIINEQKKREKCFKIQLLGVMIVTCTLPKGIVCQCVVILSTGKWKWLHGHRPECVSDASAFFGISLIASLNCFCPNWALHHFSWRM